MATQTRRRLFNVDEYYAMVEAGILAVDDRVELLDGEIIAMAPIGSRHASCVDRLSEALFEKLGRRAVLRVQGPVRLDSSTEPQPDLLLPAGTAGLLRGPSRAGRCTPADRGI